MDQPRFLYVIRENYVKRFFKSNECLSLNPRAQGSVHERVVCGKPLFQPSPRRGNGGRGPTLGTRDECHFPAPRNSCAATSASRSTRSVLPPSTFRMSASL